ncbi:hypothetical protein HYH02_005983 [Chlamydomonas schloesseri]|uniref:Uncharacterized protein n=1 Tax=Chlamydomonas schloesseri TaxID=2026947 RepID=A0A835WKU5_9CHLO|nr:hypothetical protein HYH02_005983 [Chlamydomonas schloesseri]|eukprot:KAG2449237.1 hypothetical protein HYH02_005983 [Chlamydomonas schloesseri]
MALARQQTAGENAQAAQGSGEPETPRGSGGSGTDGVAIPPGNWPRSAPSLNQHQAPVSPARPPAAGTAAAAAVAAAGGIRQAQASPSAAGNPRLPTLAGSSAERPGGLPTGRPSLNDIQREIERMEAQFLQGRTAPGSAGRPTSRRQLSALSNSTPSAPRSYDLQASPGQNQVSQATQQLATGGNPGPAPASGLAQMVGTAAGLREMRK